jgi:5-methylcytosine-specific restriction endonuclease McrA
MEAAPSHKRKSPPPFTEIHRRRMSESRTGPKHWNFGKKMPAAWRAKLSKAHKGVPLSPQHSRSISLALKGRKTPWNTGPRSRTWKGGITPILAKLRKSPAYREWRSAVLTRDGRKCVLCGATGRLDADHIKPFAQFPDLRFEISNGRALCVPCHRKTDTYGAQPPLKTA